VSAVASVPSEKSSAELFAEASAIYRKMKIEMDKLHRAGGADVLPPALVQYVTGDLTTMLSATYRYQKHSGVTTTGGPSPDKWIVPESSVVDDSLVAVAVCTDGTGVTIHEADGTTHPGDIGINYCYFKYFDGRLLAFTVQSEGVDKC
jgi:hypothetical protein